MFKPLKSVSVLLLLFAMPAAISYAASENGATSVSVTQQNGTCKGVVKDKAGEAVIGASVVVKGTTNGVITDLDGNFVLSNVPDGATIQISYVGYTPQEVKFTGKPLDITLQEDTQGTNPLFLSVLNGAFMFAADLMRNLTIPSEISFVKLASYAGTSSTGKVKELVGLNDDIEGRTVVIVEDIVDTGVTMKHLLETLQARKPKEIRIATLLLKPDKLKVELDIHYVAMRIPNDFIVGYGLDYDGLGRNYRDIYTVME